MTANRTIKHDEDLIDKLLMTGICARGSMRYALRQYHETQAQPLLDEIAEKDKLISELLGHLVSGFGGDTVFVRFFHQKGDYPFTTAVNGAIGTGDLRMIEMECSENASDTFEHGDGDYLFSVKYEPAQADDTGRVEFEAHWELDLVSFTATGGDK